MRSMRAIVVSGGMLFGSALSVAAPGDLFLLQIPGITGEVTRPRYPGWISVNSFAVGISNSAANSGGGAGAGKPLSIIKPLDTTSPELALLAANGRVQPLVTLVALSGAAGEGRFEFLKFTLRNAVVTALQLGGDSVAAAHTEQLTIAAQQITVTSTPQLPDGRPGTPVTTEIACGVSAA